MKKYAFIIIAAGLFAFTTTSCQDKGETNTDTTDTTTIPAETTVPAGAPAEGRDTTMAPPVDPAMDTTANQTPKM